MSKLSAAEAEHLFDRIPSSAPRIEQFIDGYVLSGRCAKFIVRSDPLMLRLDLSNGASLVAQVPPYRLVVAQSATYAPRSFSPPQNLLKIGSPKTGIRGPLNYIYSQDTGTGLRLGIWAGQKGSVVGTMKCVPGATRANCNLGDIFIASPNRIRRLQYMPAPNPELKGTLTLWITLPNDRQAFVSYSITGING